VWEWARCAEYSFQERVHRSTWERQVGSVRSRSRGSRAASVAAAVPGEVDVGVVADAASRAVDVDLHRPGLARRRVVLGVGHGRPDDQQRVTFAHEVPRRGRPQQADRARVPGRALVDGALAQQGGGDAGPSRFATSASSAVAPSAPAPARIAIFSPAFNSSAAARRDASGGAAIGDDGTAEVW